MNSNLQRIKKGLSKGSRVFEVRISIKFFSTDFLKNSLTKLTDEARLLKPKKVELDIFWQRETLVKKNRLVIRKLIDALRNHNINLSANLPLCLPGWKDYEKIKKFAFFDSCNDCVFKKTNACSGLVPAPKQKPILFGLPVKDFRGVALKDFFPSQNKEPITWWIPRRLDIERVVKLAEIVSQAGDLPCILDVGAGNGFLAYLLARTERVKVIGIEPNKYLIRKTKFEHENMELIAGEIESFVPNKRIDIVINSFMPYRLDFSPLVKKTIRPAAFVYIQDRKIKDERNYVYIDLKVDERKNKFEYKIDKRVSFNPDDGYKRALGWSVYSVGADRKEINSLDCEIEVQFEKNIGNINKDLVFNVNDKERYRWEKEIDQRKI